MNDAPALAVLWNPRAAFARQKAKPRGALLLLVLALCAAVPAIAYVARADMHAVVVKELKRAGQYEKIPEEQREQAIALGVTATKYGAPIGAAGARVAWILVVAALGLALLRGAARDVRYGHFLAAAALGAVPHVVEDLVLTVLFLTGDPTTYDAANPLVSNLAAVLSMDATKPLGALLAAVDAFTIWAVILTGIGFDVMRGKKGGGFWVPAGLAVAWAIVNAASKAAAG